MTLNNIFFIYLLEDHTRDYDLLQCTSQNPAVKTPQTETIFYFCKPHADWLLKKVASLSNPLPNRF